jgi:hypothetical protein
LLLFFWHLLCLEFLWVNPGLLLFFWHLLCLELLFFWHLLCLPALLLALPPMILYDAIV